MVNSAFLTPIRLSMKKHFCIMHDENIAIVEVGLGVWRKEFAARSKTSSFGQDLGLGP